MASHLTAAGPIASATTSIASPMAASHPGLAVRAASVSVDALGGLGALPSDKKGKSVSRMMKSLFSFGKGSKVQQGRIAEEVSADEGAPQLHA